MEFNEKQFITGFNSGYILAKYETTMLSTLTKGIRSDNSYIQGILSGQKEYELEQTKYRLDELEQLRKDSKEKEREL